MYKSVNEVAAMFGVSRTKIYNCHYFGHVPEPMKVGKARMYTIDDIERVKKYLERKKIDLPW